nr:gag pol polyprotein [Hymenolepis microstoma]
MCLSYNTTVKLTFDPECPDTWFLQVDNVLRVRSEELGFSIPLSHFQALSFLNLKTSHSNRRTVTPTTGTNMSREKRLHHLFSQFELEDRSPSQLLRHMRSLASDYEWSIEIPKESWVNCPQESMVPFLITSIYQDDKVAEVANRIYNHNDRLSVNAVKISAAADTISQQLDALTDRFEKLKLLISGSSPGLNRRRQISPKRRRSPSERDDRICYYHKTYGDDAKKCRPGCRKYYLQSTGISLLAANNSKIHTYGQKFLKFDLGLRQEFPFVFLTADVKKPIIGAEFPKLFWPECPPTHRQSFLEYPIRVSFYLPCPD